ncbi:DAK2 domain-containing protein [Luteipulveratus sp. YIM 133132]|uniref:DAK2 domain-containing protein n=1 Tax=Luteipulveratus flavus TaxID=3031728 RepID=UPI0023AEE4DC|nr:DAK2 domain-containing protein [Luteipulveratus sp. YIM 133132]MDE9367853.1 DAK2 domain-containing protein [Luteipulveratus sp. YIM 133132]
MTLDVLDLPALRRWVVIARADLARHAAAINGLNVFPVPDGDTGTNLVLTLDEAAREVAALRLTGLAESAEALARATLTSARGNSGVILSQLVRGVAEIAGRGTGEQLDHDDLRQALARASVLARSGVARPVEGTVLSVASAAADGCADGSSLAEVSGRAITAGRQALARTREQLDVLREAGVVDAGGAGYLLVLEALDRVVRDDPSPADGDATPEWLLAAGPVSVDAAGSDDCGPRHDGPAYEVMYLLDDSDDVRVERLRARLDALGDSVVVAGGPRVWSVHVHVDDVAAALNAGVGAGRPHRFRVTRFDVGTPPPRPVAGFGMLVVADGLGDLDGVRGSQVALVDVADVRDQPGAVVDRLRDLGGDEGVLALTDSTAAAEIVHEAAAIVGRVVHVVGSHPVHVLAGLSVIDGDGSLVDAARDALEVVDEAVVVLLERTGAEQTAQVLDRVRESGAEVVTLVTGAGAQVPAELLDGLAGVEVTVLESRARGWALAVGLE